MTRIRNSLPPIGDSLPVIAVLEDVAYRVEWLEKHFPHAHISWDKNVIDFVASVESIGLTGRLALVIMDHDLGAASELLSSPHYDGDTHDYRIDKNGHDGRDACMAMTNFDVPVLIWSANKYYSPQMENLLRTRGFAQVSSKSFEHYEDEVLQYLKNVIGL